MADDKDDNGLKKAEEALEKAERKLALTVEGTPAHKKAAEALVKAKENRLAANFRKGQRTGDLQEPPLITPAVLEPRGRGELETPPAPTAPTSPSDQVRNAMVGMRPEGNLGELPQLPEGRPEAAGAGRIQTKAEVIAEDAKTKKRREKQAKQLREAKEKAAAKQAAYDRGVAERARQAKVDTEYERSIRERHDKDKPSALEMGFATITGGLGGLLFGTYDKYIDSSRAANDEIENFRDKNRSDEAKRKALVAAKNTAAGAAAASYGWGTAAKAAATKASSTLTSNAYSPHLFKKGVPNPLSGIGSNKDGDSKEQVRAWFTKRHTQAIKGNKKAIREIGAASSRIAGKEELFKDYLKKDLVILDNRNRHQSAIIASIPAHFGITTTQGQTDYVNSLENIMHLEDKLLGQIEANNSISSYFDAMQSLADNGGDKYSKLKQAIQKELDLGVESKALKNIASMKEWMSGYENELTSIEKNLSVIKNAENAVVKLKAEAADLRGNGLHGTAEKVDKKSAEAQRQLETILALSSHSDLKLKVGKDGRTETFVDGTNVKLITQKLDPVSGKVIYALNHPYISSLPDELQPAALERAGRALTLATEHSAFTPPALIKVDEVGGTLTVSLNEYNEWKNNPKNKKQVAALNRIAESISRKVLSNDEISFEDLLNGDAAGYFSDKENAAMRNRNVRMMIRQYKEKADKIK